MKIKFNKAIIMLSMIGFLLSCCATNVATPNMPQWAQNYDGINKKDFTILGPVKIEGTWNGVFGVSILSLLGISIPNIDTGTYLFQKGGASYADLLSEAQRRYHDVDAVVNVTVDQKKSDYLFVLYSKRTYTLTGIAIRYDKPNQVSTVSTPKPAAGTTQPVSQSSAQITDIGSNYFVTQVTGKAEWFHGGAWGNIKIGDSFTRDTLINTYAYSSIVISDGTKIITTIGANQSGSISAFLNN